MKREMASHLRCLDCSGTDWNVEAIIENKKEIREGSLTCSSCHRLYPIREGILDALGELPEEVHHEKEHSEAFGYIRDEAGKGYPINRENIQRFKNLFLNLPAGDGSHYFRPGGSFDNQAGNAARFFKTLELLKLKGNERVLEVGASFGWASWRFAQKGCEVTALDVTDYLQTADLYLEQDGIYFDRLMADMSVLPFRDNTFDLIFSHSVIHHCKDLSKLFSEFRRVLKPGGRVVALHECAFGLLEDKSGAALQDAIHEGFNENAYTVPQWVKGARQGGFRTVDLHFFSFIEDYIERKEQRGAKDSSKLRLARWVRSKPLLHRCINALSVWPRIFLRPKAWLIMATK